MSLQSLPDVFRDRLVSEYRIAITKIAEPRSPAEYIYYYSIFYGEVVRILNWHWDETLALIWSNVQHAHNAMQARISTMNQGERVAALSPEFFNAVTANSVELANYIENPSDDAELCRILGRLAELTYATTGNGYYLLEKGTIKL